MRYSGQKADGMKKPERAEAVSYNGKSKRRPQTVRDKEAVAPPPKNNHNDCPDNIYHKCYEAPARAGLIRDNESGNQCCS